MALVKSILSTLRRVKSENGISSVEWAFFLWFVGLFLDGALKDAAVYSGVDWIDLEGRVGSEGGVEASSRVSGEDRC
jgi:hypothetical protein